MTEGKPRNRWSELNDMVVIQAMLTNRDSEHWDTCSKFIRYYIDKQFSNLPPHLKDEAVQETLLSAHRGLSTFRYQSKFTTWLAAIARNRAIDALRQQADIMYWETHPNDPPESLEDSEGSATNMPRTPEEIALTRERIRETFAAIEVFIRMHVKSGRNRQILHMVLLEGYSHEEVAQTLGISAAVVGYVVRSARDYLRHWLSDTHELQQ